MSSLHDISAARKAHDQQRRAFDRLVEKHSPAARSEARWTLACILILATAAFIVAAFYGVAAYRMLLYGESTSSLLSRQIPSHTRPDL